MEHVVAECVKRLSLGAPVSFENLTVFPLEGAGVERPGYLTLDEALLQGVVEIAEVSEGGSVPHVQVRNRAPQPVLLVDGEELVGAKQNRIVNLTILVPATHTLIIPVSCVEVGRWHHNAAAFAAAPRAQYAKARAQKVRDVTASLTHEGARHADQQAIWQDIEEKSRRMQAASATGAMAAIFERHAAPIEAYVGAFIAGDRQLGAVFAIDGAVVGLDCFDSAETLRKILPKLVRSYAADAVETARRRHRPAARREAGSLLAAVAAAAPSEFPAVGLGVDLRLESGAVTGAGLAVDSSVVHLTAFAGMAGAKGGSRISRRRPRGTAAEGAGPGR
jgi:hypothetical protein